MSGDELRDRWNHRDSHDHRAQPVYTAGEYEELEAENKRLRSYMEGVIREEGCMDDANCPATGYPFEDWCIPCQMTLVLQSHD